MSNEDLSPNLLIAMKYNIADLYIDTDDITSTLNEIDNINMERKEQEKDIINVKNIYEENLKNESIGYIIRIVVYTLIGSITLFSAINIFNTIYTSVALRKREIASLKSIGMTKKQINKMFLYEGIIYGIDGLLYGGILSLIILYVIYMLDEYKRNIYAFQYPFGSLLITAFAVYVTTFLAIHIARKKLDEENIIDEIRNENI